MGTQILTPEVVAELEALLAQRDRNALPDLHNFISLLWLSGLGKARAAAEDVA